NSMAVVEKLIQSVYAYPVLYNVSFHDYRSSERRAKAWREVAASVGLSVVECKRRWKTIRDRYIRERRLCKLGKEQGGRRLHFWPHREALSFLDAHIRKRKRHNDAEGPDELDEGAGSGQDSHDESLDESSAQLNPLSQLPLSIVTQLAPIKQVPQMTQLVPLVTGLPPGLKVSPASASPSQQIPIKTNTAPALLAANINGKMAEKEPASQKPALDRALDEDELFLLSYVPALKRLTPQKRAAVKMKIQQLMFDAEFKDE
ncbi:hypothetical protein IRJ41_016876, partial [Triplophysa rosa]